MLLNRAERADMARPQKYRISKIADFNRIASLCFYGFLTETEGAKVLDMNKVTFKNKMDEWMTATADMRKLTQSILIEKEEAC